MSDAAPEGAEVERLREDVRRLTARTQTVYVGYLEAERDRYRETMEWAYMRALRIAEPAYTAEGTVIAAESIAKRLRGTLDSEAGKR